MLSRLIIKNFAIIKELEVSFTSGLNVITGETGAGKSIIIDALLLLSGIRASTDLIREGEDSCEIQGLFEFDKLTKTTKNIFKKNDLEPVNEIIIRRIVQRNGRSRAYINGVIVTQSLLLEIGESLISALTQHENQKLFSSVSQLELLDRFLNISEEVEELKSLYEKINEKQKSVDNLKNMQAEYIKKADYLQFQLKEVEELDLQPEEETAFIEFVKKGENSVQVISTIESLLDRLSYSDMSVSSNIHGMIKDSMRLSSIDPLFDQVSENLNDLLIKAEDILSKCKNLQKNYNVDPQELEEKKEKLQELKRLKKKFVCADLFELMVSYKKMKEELNSLEDIDNKIEKSVHELDLLKKEFNNSADSISKKRFAGRDKLSDRIESFLSKLGIYSGGFIVDLQKTESATGFEKAEFMISTNPGEPMKSIAKIASGGELSRIMLAIQAATNEVYSFETQIFDEVDAGIGGETGFKIGELLGFISRNRQLIVITHLPQLAVFCKNHIKIWKQEENARTIVRLESMDEQQRLNEVSRMLGMENKASAIENARQMQDKAKNLLQSA